MAQEKVTIDLLVSKFHIPTVVLILLDFNEILTIVYLLKNSVLFLFSCFISDYISNFIVEHFPYPIPELAPPVFIVSTTT